MSTAIPDLWPTDFGTVSQPSPASILREQGYLLGQRTRNTVVGSVVSKSPKPGEFLHEFYISAPVLDFRQRIVLARHGVDFYPAVLTALYVNKDGTDRASGEAKDAEMFMAYLREFLAHDQVVTLVRSLSDQCRQPDRDL